MTTTPHLTFRRGRYILATEHGDIDLPRVTTIIAEGYPKLSLDAWKKRVGDVEAERRRDEGAAFGTAVHAAIEAVARARMSGKAYRPDAAAAGKYGRFLDEYVGWLDEHVERIEAVERLVYHPKRRYAGTLDQLVVMRDGRRALVDVKTSGYLSGTFGLQLAAYAQALEAHGEPVERRIILHLPKKAGGDLFTHEYGEDEIRDDDRTWKAVLRVWRHYFAHEADWKHVKGVRG